MASEMASEMVSQFILVTAPQATALLSVSSCSFFGGVGSRGETICDPRFVFDIFFDICLLDLLVHTQTHDSIFILRCKIFSSSLALADTLNLGTVRSHRCVALPSS